MAEATPAVGMGSKAKYIIGGLVIVVILLAVANYFYMKKIKELNNKPVATTPTLKDKLASTPKTADINTTPVNTKVAAGDLTADEIPRT